MALPTGKHALQLSLRAKLLKAHVIASDLGYDNVAAKALALFTEVDAKVAPNAKNSTRKLAAVIEEDIATE